MAGTSVDFMRDRIRRRIVIKSAVFGFWAVSMIAMMVQGGVDLAGSTFLYMTIAVLAAWVTSTVRDVRRLRDEAYLRQAAVAETDERNVMITYKATRLAAVILGCAAPVAICILAYLGMEQAVSTLAVTICAFLIAYVVSWAYVSRTC